jgi:hypothetical protein
VGTGIRLPPPTDPNAGYPPNYWDAGYLPRSLVAQYPYTALGLSVEGSHVRFSVSVNEVWKAWCELQTKTYLIDGGSYHCCVPEAFVDAGPDSGRGQAVCDAEEFPPNTDPGKIAVCTDVVGLGCTCTTAGCTVDLSKPGVSFDAQLQGDSLNGAVLGIDTTNAIYNVYLTRVN